MAIENVGRTFGPEHVGTMYDHASKEEVPTSIGGEIEVVYNRETGQMDVRYVPKVTII